MVYEDADLQGAQWPAALKHKRKSPANPDAISA
jgi:hypothetical protein